MVTDSANSIALTSASAATLSTISVISLQTSAGEIFRKAPTSTEAIAEYKTRFTFYLSESEGVGSITEMSLYGVGATTTLGSGTELVKQAVNIVKTSTQSLTIEWTVEVK